MQNGKSTNVKYAEYIKRIEIDSLWSGKKHIIWNLQQRSG